VNTMSLQPISSIQGTTGDPGRPRPSEVGLSGLEKVLDEAEAPATPGRLPEWKEK
jgi:hypothetical protein